MLTVVQPAPFGIPAPSEACKFFQGLLKEAVHPVQQLFLLYDPERKQV